MNSNKSTLKRCLLAFSAANNNNGQQRATHGKGGGGGSEAGCSSTCRKKVQSSEWERWYLTGVKKIADFPGKCLLGSVHKDGSDKQVALLIFESYFTGGSPAMFVLKWLLCGRLHVLDQRALV